MLRLCWRFHIAFRATTFFFPSYLPDSTITCILASAWVPVIWHYLVSSKRSTILATAVVRDHVARPLYFTCIRCRRVCQLGTPQLFDNRFSVFWPDSDLRNMSNCNWIRILTWIVILSNFHSTCQWTWLFGWALGHFPDRWITWDISFVLLRTIPIDIRIRILNFQWGDASRIPADGGTLWR